MHSRKLCWEKRLRVFFSLDFSSFFKAELMGDAATLPIFWGQSVNLLHSILVISNMVEILL